MSVPGMIGFEPSVGPCSRQPESLRSTIVNGGCAASTAARRSLRSLQSGVDAGRFRQRTVRRDRHVFARRRGPQRHDDGFLRLAAQPVQYLRQADDDIDRQCRRLALAAAHDHRPLVGANDVELREYPASLARSPATNSRPDGRGHREASRIRRASPSGADVESRQRRVPADSPAQSARSPRHCRDRPRIRARPSGLGRAVEHHGLGPAWNRLAHPERLMRRQSDRRS